MQNYGSTGESKGSLQLHLGLFAADQERRMEKCELVECEPVLGRIHKHTRDTAIGMYNGNKTAYTNSKQKAHEAYSEAILLFDSETIVPHFEERMKEEDEFFRLCEIYAERVGLWK
jgi:hypothetical protein